MLPVLLALGLASWLLQTVLVPRLLRGQLACEALVWELRPRGVAVGLRGVSARAPLLEMINEYGLGGYLPAQLVEARADEIWLTVRRDLGHRTVVSRRG